MPTERLSMRRIRQVLQLHFGAHASARVIAREVGIGRTTVQDYLARATAAGSERDRATIRATANRSGARAANAGRVV